MSQAIRVVGLAMALALSAQLAPGVYTPALGSHSGGSSAFSLDMDPTGNSATALGARQTCARIQLNGIQDADEDSVDAILADVTISEIPAVNAAIGVQYFVNYSEASLSVQTYQGAFLLASTSGSSIFDASDPVPDTDNSGRWYGAEADISTSTPESGSGVFHRLTLSADVGASTGVYDLTLTEAGHADSNNDSFAPDTVEDARLTVGVPCPPTDTDGDKVWDVDEVQCGSDPNNGTRRPERIDGVFAGVDDDGDALIDEALPTNIPMADCDGDGYPGPAESWVYAPSTTGDQDPCGTAPASAPFNAPIGWPADFKAGGTPDSTNKITITDLTSFLAPVYRLNTSPGDAGYDKRWDIVPGNSGQAKDINSVDQGSVNSVKPAMLGSVRAMNGPACPWPP